MTLKKTLITTLLVTTFFSNLYSSTDCTKNSINQLICAPLHGTIHTNSIKQVVCGVGKCKKNSIGQIMCSKTIGGFATVNSIGQVICSGGCIEASRSLCKTPSR